MAAVEPKVWVVDDDASVRWVLDKALRSDGMSPRCFDEPVSLLSSLDADHPDVLITDVRMPGMDGMQLMQALDAAGHAFPIIVMTAHADLDAAVAAYSRGAFEYLPKPFDVDEVVALVRRAALRGVAASANDHINPSMPSMIGQAPAMQEVFRTIGRLARSSMNVLVTGESGTGKELVAQALHEHSPRSGKPFVALNTTAIAAELLESELFGHERGAFTGAETRRIGRFEQADGGTLFLDEIGDMSPDLQTRLLRVLAENEFYRVGGQTPISVDVRVIAATNQDLEQAVATGQFREDLFHRLNVIHIKTPALRDRSEDVPLLLEHFLAQAADELDTEAKSLSTDAMSLLRNFDWPGNVRQLINACRRLTVQAPGRIIHPSDVPRDLGGEAAAADRGEWVRDLSRWAERRLHQPASAPLLDEALPEFERALIKAALAHVKGHKQEAAKLLGWGRNTLARKMKELGVE